MLQHKVQHTSFDWFNAELTKGKAPENRVLSPVWFNRLRGVSLVTSGVLSYNRLRGVSVVTTDVLSYDRLGGVSLLTSVVLSYDRLRAVSLLTSYLMGRRAQSNK